MRAIIIGAGRGRRLMPNTENHPKCFARVQGRRILDWQNKAGFGVSDLINGEGFNKSHIQYKSSVNVRNLRQIEEELKKLWSPQ